MSGHIEPPESRAISVALSGAMRSHSVTRCRGDESIVEGAASTLIAIAEGAEFQTKTHLERNNRDEAVRRKRACLFRLPIY